MDLLKQGKESSLGEFESRVDEAFFKNTFRVAAAATKTFVLMLSNNSPKSLLSGKHLDLDRVLQKYNRSEFHHIYPRAFLRDQGYDDQLINSLANFCFLSGAENRSIGRKKPSVYFKEIAENGDDLNERLASAFCEIQDFNDQYDEFFAARIVRLRDFAVKLLD